MLKKVVIIGTGNVAWQLAHSLPLLGYCVVQIWGRNVDKAESLAMSVGADYTANYSEIYPDADFYIYAVTDNALQEVIGKNPISEGVHIHTSGSVGIEVFATTKQRYGVIYPCQTFTFGKKVDLSRIAFFVEGNNKDTEAEILQFAKKISLKVFVSDSQQRRRVHLANVVAANFANALWSKASDILRSEGLRFQDVCLPLVEEALDKLRYMSPAEAQTGPAKRGDTQTIDKHLQLLQSDISFQDIYKQLTELIILQNR